MSTVQAIEKIERMRAAVGAARDPDLTKVKVKVVRRSPRHVTVQHDFSGGFTKAQLQNQLWTVIRAIADLEDHLRKWASAKGHPKEEVDQTIAGCLELQLIIDLADFDKHGGHHRNGGESGFSPFLDKVRRGLVVRGTKASGGVGFSVLPDGSLRAKGAAAITILGDVVLRDGRRLEVDGVQQRAIEAWEALFHHYGIAA